MRHDQEHDWDATHNDGGEGYNPHRDARKVAEIKEAAKTMSPGERKYYLMRKAESLRRLARESDDAAAKLAAIEAEIAEIEQSQRN